METINERVAPAAVSPTALADLGPTEHPSRVTSSIDDTGSGGLLLGRFELTLTLSIDGDRQPNLASFSPWPRSWWTRILKIRFLP